MASSEDSRKAELTFRGMYLFHYSLYPNVMFMCCSTLSGEHVYSILKTFLFTLPLSFMSCPAQPSQLSLFIHEIGNRILSMGLSAHTYI